MSVQRAGTDIGASRELEVFPLVDAFPGTVPSMFIMTGTPGSKEDDRWEST